MILAPQTALSNGHYIVQRHLDSGAMADVYLATDTQRAVNVALKVLRSELSLDEYFEEYFRREAAVLQQLQHPNIVRLYELERDSNLLFLVMDYIEGPTLQQHLFEKKLLQTAYVLKIGQVLAAALDYAHKKGVIHRDIKPSNVLLANSGVILLNDFGVARVVGNTTSAGASGPVGTLAYMAPEQIGGADITGAADQYALAVVIWELLSGRRPFTGKASKLTASPLSERIIDEHLHHMPPADILPPDLTSALSRALAKDPHQRFPTCAAFMQVLQAAATKEMPSAAVGSAAKTEDNPVTSQLLQTSAGPEAPRDALLGHRASVANKDELIAQAIALVKKHRIASASLLQRKLQLSYPRAARLMDELEEMGIIGREQAGGKTREVLLQDDDEIFTTPKTEQISHAAPDVDISNSIEPTQNIREVLIDPLSHPAVTASFNYGGWTGLQFVLLLILLLILLIVTVVAAPQLFQSFILSFVRFVLSAAFFLLALVNLYLLLSRKWKLLPLAIIAAIAISFGGSRVTGQIELNQALQIEVAVLATQAAAPTVTAAPTDVAAGTIAFDGGQYIGELSNGLPNGQGTWTTINDYKYIGTWKQGKRNGQGTKTQADGSSYTGEWKDNKLNGQGSITYADGGKYIGELSNALADGQGTYTFANGDKYTGKFKAGDLNGQGTITFANGSKYTGSWANGKVVPTATALPTATELPTATALPPATKTPAATALPAATQAPAATALPTATALPAATALPTETASPPPTALPTTPPITLSMENARRKAESYLRYMSFSRTGLIEQLKYSGFPEADAIYGVDALNVDWNDQAAQKAASYLKYMPFSRSGLIDQLIFTGFTPEQAEYGVSTTGL